MVTPAAAATRGSKHVQCVALLRAEARPWARSRSSPLPIRHSFAAAGRAFLLLDQLHDLCFVVCTLAGARVIELLYEPPRDPTERRRQQGLAHDGPVHLDAVRGGQIHCIVRACNHGHCGVRTKCEPPTPQVLRGGRCHSVAEAPNTDGRHGKQEREPVGSKQSATSVVAACTTPSTHVFSMGDATLAWYSHLGSK